MATEDPWDAPDPKKLRISSVPATRPLDRRPPERSSRSTPAQPPPHPPPHHASPRPEHGVVDEAAVEAPPIPRPEQPQAPRPAMIDTRVSQGQTPVMVDGLDGATWREHDDGPHAPKPPPVRPWARHAAITIGAIAMLTILAAVAYVLGVGAIRAIKETDPDRAAEAPVVRPSPPTPTEPATFEDPPPTSIIGEDEVPLTPIELPPEVDPYGGEEIDPLEESD